MLTNDFLDLPPIALNVLNSLLVVIIGLLVIYIFKKTLKAIFKTSKKKFPQKNYDTALTVLSSLVKYAIYFFMAFKILAIFGMPVESMLAVAGVGSIALGFGARGITEDLITGATILFENQFQVGDNIEVNGKSGCVESIGLRSTTIRSYDGDVHIFPNSTIKLVTNMSKSFNRAVVDIPVPHTESADRVLAILEDEMNRVNGHENAMLSRPAVQGIVEMNSQYYTVRVIVDCKIGQNWAIERLLRLLIRSRFDKEGVAPPYPHQYFHNM